MSRSNAPRDRLVNPWHLVLAIVGFIAAFVWIAPAREELTLQDAAIGSAISELDVAYLKAQRASEQQSSEDVYKMATLLVRAQRADEAEALLASRPDVRMSRTDELALLLERHLIKFNKESSRKNPNQDLVNEHRYALITTLKEIVDQNNIDRSDLLVRSQEVAVLVNRLQFAGEISERLATVDSKNASHWLGECARNFDLAKELDRALDCATRNTELATAGEERFSAMVNELSLASRLNNRPRVDRLVKSLIETADPTAEGLKYTADQLLAIERPLDAAKAFARLSVVDPDQSGKWLEQAARWSEAGGKSGEAAAYLELKLAEAPEGERKAIEKNISRLVIASGDNDAVIERYQQKIAAGDNSKLTLTEAIKAATGGSRRDVAQEWNNQLVQNYPDSAEGWVFQYDLSLAAADLPSALAAAKTLVDLQPQVAGFHIRLAKVAEWSGDPNLATAEWLWLSERYPSIDTLTELTRLSKLTLQPSLTAEALRQRSIRKKPTPNQVAELVDAYELEGTPKLAVSAIEDILKRYGADRQLLIHLAKLHEHHVDFEPAEAVWVRYEAQFGQNVESRLYLAEYRWRLKKSQEALSAALLIPNLVGSDTRLLDSASEYQIRLLADLGWRFEKPELVALSESHLTRIEDDSKQFLLRRRAIDVANQEGKLDQAIESASVLYADTESSSSAMLHMRLLIEGLRLDGTDSSGYDAAVQPYLAHNSETLELRQDVSYWTLIAQYQLNKGEQEMAKRAYRSALELSPENPDVLAGLLWMHIGSGDIEELTSFIEIYGPLAEQSRVLWTPMGVAYMQLGLPAGSLTWFERQLETIEADYSLLLTYADALEAAGRTEHAYKVRHYAIDALRPLLTLEGETDQNELLQQYARMVVKFGSSDQKERFTQGVIDTQSDEIISKDKFWQQEMAIAWLMATQRHDLARVVLTKLHEQRLNAPAWQALAVAMKQNDLDTVAQIVQSGQGISVGDNMLALRKLGRNDEAYSLAINTLQTGLSGSSVELADSTYRALRQYRPVFAGAGVSNSVSSGLDVLESLFRARQTFSGTTLGISIDARRKQFSSERYLLSADDDQTDIALTLHYGDAGLNSRLTAGYLADGEKDQTYFIGGISSQFNEGKSDFDVEVAINEVPTASTLLKLRGAQNRASAQLGLSVGKVGFVRFSADVTDISSRITESRVARGLSGIAEIGVRGSFGSHSWSGSVTASTVANDREDELPADFELNNLVTIDEVITDKFSNLSVGASLSRGNTDSNFPQVSSPRYFVNARVGHSWPDNNFGVQFDAGAGVRVIGGDELSIGFSHDGLVDDVIGQGSSRLGINYRFHFN